jgi:hypothetical protein
VLVSSDSTSNNLWSIYTWEPTSAIWSKTKSQSYDVRNFWKYIDWYGTYIDLETNIETPYSQFTKLNTNTEGSYFDFYTTMMYPERYYKFEVKSTLSGVTTYFKSNDFIFKIIK